jgi:hypothetical protein
MQEEQQVLEAEVQEAPVQTAETEQPQEQNAQQDSPEDIQEATGMGWVPKERFKGDPNLWRPASEFVRRGREILPIIQKRERSLQDKVRSLETQMEERDRAFEERARRLDGMARAALERQRAQLESAYEAAKRKAVADGDVEAYDKLSDEGRRAVASFNPEEEAERYAPKPPDKQPQIPENIHKAVTSWIADNPWFDRDEELREIASFEHGRLLKRMPGLSIEDNLQKTLEYVEERYPDKFGSRQPAQTQQPHSPAVEGGGRQAQISAGGRARSWGDLPPEAKASGERFISRDGLFLPKGADPENLTDKDIQAARSAFAKQYWEQEV